jgi:hypothetical protein
MVGKMKAMIESFNLTSKICARFCVMSKIRALHLGTMTMTLKLMISCETKLSLHTVVPLPFQNSPSEFLFYFSFFHFGPIITILLRIWI